MLNSLGHRNNLDCTRLSEIITIYLSDHLAGSVVALELLNDLIASPHCPALHPQWSAMHRSIKDDQILLTGVLQTLGAEPDRLKEAAAWFSEKLARVKLRFSNRPHGALAVFEALEILALGIEGKRLMWLALEHVGLDELLPSETTFNQLQLSAYHQQKQVEQWRLKVAKQVFSPCQSELRKLS